MLYRGREAMLVWVLHRVTGVGVAVFLLVHILDTSLVALGPDHYNQFVAVYRLPLIRVLEVALAGSVIYHAGNGIRVTLLDFWPKAADYDRLMILIGAVLFPLVFIPTAFLMLRPLFS